MTTSIKGIQQTLLKEKTDKTKLLKEEDIAKALAERNLLRLTHTIQISANRQFSAITFQNTQIIETFCTEPLLVRGFNITFRAKKDFPKKKKNKETFCTEPLLVRGFNITFRAKKDFPKKKKNKVKYKLPQHPS